MLETVKQITVWCAARWVGADVGVVPQKVVWWRVHVLHAAASPGVSVIISLCLKCQIMLHVSVSVCNENTTRE